MTIKIIDCACLIHGDKYPFKYVEVLYNQLSRAFSYPIRFHVFCEGDRIIPQPWIKHELIDWQLRGANRAWWYKMQLFQQGHFDSNVMYFDLDMVILGNLDWINNLPQEYFWSIQDFKYLWRPSSTMMNSSVMLWHAPSHWQVYDNFRLDQDTRLHRGDQEYLSTVIKPPLLRFFEHSKVMSWRWQACGGGYDFNHRRHLDPLRPAQVPGSVNFLVFHGDPKPHEIQDPIIEEHWC